MLVHTQVVNSIPNTKELKITTTFTTQQLKQMLEQSEKDDFVKQRKQECAEKAGLLWEKEELVINALTDAIQSITDMSKQEMTANDVPLLYVNDLTACLQEVRKIQYQRVFC